MQIRLTVSDPSGHEPPRDVLVDAPDGATATDLGHALCPAEPTTTPPRLYAGGLLVPPGTAVGCPPLLDGAVLTLGRPGLRPPRHAPGLLELHVVGGPDAGHVFRLPPGEHRLGRAAEADLRVADPDLSRVHALVTVDATRVTVTDLGSTNGTEVDDASVAPGEPVELAPQDRLRVGSTTLRLRVPQRVPAAVTPDRCGHLLVNRRPRFLPERTPAVVELPAPPPEPARARLPVLAMVLPLALSAPLAALMQAPAMLLFALLSPVLGLGQWLSDRRGGRRRGRRAVTAYEAARAAADRLLADALREEAAACHDAHPDLAAVLCATDGPQAQLWQRRRGDPDWLELRVGTGARAAATRVTCAGDAAWPAAAGAGTGAGTDAGPRVPRLSGVPVSVDLKRFGVVGVAGPRERTLGVARAMLAQAAVWHSPADLRIVVLSAARDAEADWAWTAYLPHNRADDAAGAKLLGVLAPDGGQVPLRVAELSALLGHRSAVGRPGAGSAATPAVLVVLDGAQRLRAVPGLTALLADGPPVGVTFLAVDEAPAQLPVETVAVIEIGAGPGATATVSAGGGRDEDVVPDEASRRWAQRLARALAPLRDATPSEGPASLPERSRLLDLLGPQSLEPRTIGERWLARPRTTRALLGVTASGPLWVDLSRDGPHALVGGTTGSGKSELLQTLIASLAVGNRPDELAFLLVDYKGGAAFAECARLPHTVGVVTDLDAALTERALTSLGAELRRRERLLANAGATDIEDYQRISGTGAPRLARLVLVIDEFRMLAEELPDFVHGLVRVAAVGRSLGVHLVLATQRPGGIVSADIRANVNLRIALRVRDAMDSTDVIECADATGIPETAPGRAYLRSAATPLVQFQTARVGGSAIAAAAIAAAAPASGPVAPTSPTAPVTVTSLRWSALGEPPAAPAARKAGDGPTDLAAIVSATSAAAARHGIPPTSAPWLPPLPAVVDAAGLTASPDVIGIGLEDDPAGQAQRPFGWDLLAGGHLGVAGSARSGRTSLLRTIAGQVAAHISPADVHLYAVHAGGLAALAGLPHAGAVVPREDTALVGRLLRRLAGLVANRRGQLARDAFATLAEQRAGAGSTGGWPLPYLLLLVDGWEGFVQSVEPVEHGRLVEDLLQVMRDGEPAGLRVVVTGERALLTGRLASAMGTRLVLPMTDPLDLALVGLPPRPGHVPRPPGRALDASEHKEIQIATVAKGLSGPGQAARLEELASLARRRWADLSAERLPVQVEPLPVLVHLEAVLDGAAGGPGRDRVLVGVGGDNMDALGFDLARGQRRLTVLGPPGSGRSTALCAIGRSLAAGGRPVVAVTTRGETVNGLAGVAGVLAVLSHRQADALIGLRRTHPDLAVLVDDAEGTVESPVEPALLEILALVDEDDGVVVVATTPAALLAARRGIHAEAARSRCGILLGPNGPHDGDLLAARVPASTERLPGRGHLVTEAEVTPLQVALPQ